MTFPIFCLSILIPALAPAFGKTQSAPTSVSLREDRFDSVLKQALEKVYDQDYKSADSLIKAGIPEGEPCRNYFLGVVGFSSFNDLGDTVALFRSQRLWESLVIQRPDEKNAPSFSSARNLDLYQALANLQLSHIAQTLDHSLSSAWLARRAISQLKKNRKFVEAEAAISLYEYYKGALLKNLEWIPFVDGRGDAAIQNLERLYTASNYLSIALQTSLLWIYYDKSQYDKGLNLINRFLALHPGNRVYRQIKADFHFRKGELTLSRELYEHLQREYSSFQKDSSLSRNLPLGFLCATGNLVKIYHSLNDKEAKKRQASIWFGPQGQNHAIWLPSSLKKEVSTLRNNLH